MSELFSKSEAAIYLHVSVATVDRWARQGRISPLRSGGRTILYRKSDLDAFLEEGSNANAIRQTQGS